MDLAPPSSGSGGNGPGTFVLPVPPPVVPMSQMPMVWANCSLCSTPLIPGNALECGQCHLGYHWECCQSHSANTSCQPGVLPTNFWTGGNMGNPAYVDSPPAPIGVQPGLGQWGEAAPSGGPEGKTEETTRGRGLERDFRPTPSAKGKDRVPTSKQPPPLPSRPPLPPKAWSSAGESSSDGGRWDGGGGSRSVPRSRRGSVAESP